MYCFIDTPSKDTTDAVEDLIGLEFLANLFQLVEQDLEYLAFASRRSDEVKNNHRIVFLQIPMNAAHALFEPCGVPGHVVVDHDPAELKVDAFACRVRADQESSTTLARRLAKSFHLFFALDVVHAAMNLSNLPGVTHAAETIHQEIAGCLDAR